MEAFGGFQAEVILMAGTTSSAATFSKCGRRIVYGTLVSTEECPFMWQQLVASLKYWRNLLALYLKAGLNPQAPTYGIQDPSMSSMTALRELRSWQCTSLYAAAGPLALNHRGRVMYGTSRKLLRSSNSLRKSDIKSEFHLASFGLKHHINSERLPMTHN